MTHRKSHNLIKISLLFFAVLFLTACTAVPTVNLPTETLSQPADTDTDTDTATPTMPSPTPQPLAARVNGEDILMDDFSGEILRYQAALTANGEESTTEEQEIIVLNDMIDQLLLSQSAFDAGFILDDEALQARLDELSTAIGGHEQLSDWIIRNGYNEASLKRLLYISIAAAWQRDQLASSTPLNDEQVLARQILVLDANTANQLHQQLLDGTDFAVLAKKYDPLTGGALGWFPRGYLTQADIETAAFTLNPGQHSEVIQTPIGYHIIQVLEREEERPLSPDTYKMKQHTLIINWLTEKKSDSEIEILIP